MERRRAWIVRVPSDRRAATEWWRPRRLAASARAPRAWRTNYRLVALVCVVVGLVLTSSWLALSYARADAPLLTAEAAIALDLDTGDVLFEKNAGQRMYPASLTKLMTAILLAERMDPSDVLTYSARAQAQEPVRLDLPPGSVMTTADAMDAMLIGSANDVAYMVAENVAGSAAAFVRMMNSKAKEMGLLSTHFVTPSGLHDDDHYSTAADLAALFREALSDPWIRDTLATHKATLAATPVAITVTNTNPLLGSTGCVAGKTGYTSMAGKCLAALFERHGRPVIAVVLKSETDETLISDMEAVANWSFR